MNALGIPRKQHLLGLVVTEGIKENHKLTVCGSGIKTLVLKLSSTGIETNTNFQNYFTFNHLSHHANLSMENGINTSIESLRSDLFRLIMNYSHKLE